MYSHQQTGSADSRGRWFLIIIGAGLILVATLLILFRRSSTVVLSPIPEIFPTKRPLLPNLFPKSKSPDQLRRKIQTIVDNRWANYSVYVKDYASEFSLGINETVIYTAASVNKLPILTTLYYKAQKGEIDLDELVLSIDANALEAQMKEEATRAANAAEQEPRDSHGRFVSIHQDANPVSSPNPQPRPIPSTAPTIPNYPNVQNTPNPSLPPVPSTPPEPQVVHNTGSNGGGNNSDDDPLFEAKINNPFSKFFNWLKKLIKNEGINIKIKPLTAIAMVVALTGGGGLIGGVVGYAFPHSSPLLHREVAYQGNIQKTSNGIFLILPNSDRYTLRPKINSTVNFQNLNSGQAFVKGNLTPENFVIEVSEVIPLNNGNAQPNP